MVGSRLRQGVTLWIIAALTLATLSTSGNVGPTRSASQAEGLLDPIAAAATTAFYQSDPPAGQPVIVSRPLERSDVPVNLRLWTVMWLSGTGRLCGALIAQSRSNDGFCYTDQATQLIPAPGRAMSLNFVADKGYFQAKAFVQPGIATVTASTAVTPDQTATVVRLALPNGADIGLFALTLYARNVSLGDITWIFRDAHGNVVATEVTNEWGQKTAA
ncbi:hypothetical protein Rhe02_63660 [Rhizocola hellebori]|uniref:Uncharacterized protein n=1 Tax=Rhizocola hellebori TaxID=1392758 RepID=A0A8J3QEM7_9ACTN|nr:hypothetical protein [Rhizocola hellebori]GIH08299.1 hypothetical protein Rhe02_63660 [Rhizocola hellebori]